MPLYPQPGTATRLLQRRRALSALQSSKEISGGPPTALSTAFPLPDWSVALQIRRGDKASEMELVEIRNYFHAAHMVS